uniref:Uncharacterized protein n=1 Tax=Romanomermis culicivorax TaxID=13658 RepID=A0A915HFY8_ROMCU
MDKYVTVITVPLKKPLILDGDWEVALKQLIFKPDPLKKRGFVFFISSVESIHPVKFKITYLEWPILKLTTYDS